MFKPAKAKNEKEYIAAIEEPRKSEIIELDQFIKKTVPSLKPNYVFNMLGYGMFYYKRSLRAYAFNLNQVGKGTGQ